MVGIGPIFFGLVNLGVAKWVTLLSVYIISIYSYQKPIKIGWVCAVVYCVLKKGDINLRTRWQNRRGHQSPFSENYVKSTMNYIIIHYLYILIYRSGSLGNTPRIQSKASWFEPRWLLYLGYLKLRSGGIGLPCCKWYRTSDLGTYTEDTRDWDPILLLVSTTITSIICSIYYLRSTCSARGMHIRSRDLIKRWMINALDQDLHVFMFLIA